MLPGGAAFSIAGGWLAVLDWGVRRLFLLVLLVLLGLAVGFAGWRAWTPYDRAAAAGAPLALKRVWVTRDHGFCWVDIDLKAAGGYRLAQSDRILLLTGAGAQLAPAALGAPLRAGAGGPALRFWVEAAELDGPLTLIVGAERLRVKSAGPAPALGEGARREQRSPNW